MKRLPIKEGQRYERLLVLARAGYQSHNLLWMCVCDCGNFALFAGTKLANGKKKCCDLCAGPSINGGAPKRYLGADSRSRTYGVWKSMIQRCTKTYCESYELYGGRGIGVCEEWLDFANFLRDMGEKPDGLSIDRIDNDKGYSSDNCRWTDSFTQNRNRRGNVHIEHNGEIMVASDWAKKLGISRATIYNRLKLGMTSEQVLMPTKAGKLAKKPEA